MRGVRHSSSPVTPIEPHPSLHMPIKLVDNFYTLVDLEGAWLRSNELCKYASVGATPKAGTRTSKAGAPPMATCLDHAVTTSQSNANALSTARTTHVPHVPFSPPQVRPQSARGSERMVSARPPLRARPQSATSVFVREKRHTSAPAEAWHRMVTPLPPQRGWPGALQVQRSAFAATHRSIRPSSAPSNYVYSSFASSDTSVAVPSARPSTPTRSSIAADALHDHTHHHTRWPI